MEIIHKTISLEDFKNRFPESFNAEWGEVMTHDYLIDPSTDIGRALYEIRDRIPLVYDDPFDSSRTENDRTRLRFGNMISLYGWLDRVLNDSLFYKICKRGGEHIWVEDDLEEFTGTLMDVFSELPSTDGYEIGAMVWITPDAEQIKSIFVLENETTLVQGINRIFRFMTFVENARKNLEVTTTESGYTDIKIMLTENCNDIGIYTESGETEYNIEEGSAITIFTESRLSQVTRYKKSYDDDGNELPFAVSIGGTREDYSLGDIKNGDVSVGFANPEFLTGVSYNVHVNDAGKVCGDYMKEIATGDGIIFFTYVIGAEILSGGTYDGGITYYEEYKLGEEESLNFRYEGTGLTATFRRILYSEQPDEYKDAEGYEDGKRFAFATYTSQFKTETGNLVYFKEESLTGIDDIRIDDEKPRVERGTSAAFEIHNILGECRTMDDLEKYRNDFFTIKDDEKQ